jgi:hypothetical protein
MEYHILNGDSLNYQFPKNLPGELLIARECLVEGDVGGNTLQEFLANRAKYISNTYDESIEDYQKKVAPQFLSISEIKEQSIVNLWFEEDLFCQVNLWFVCSLLAEKQIEFFLVLPVGSMQYGFGGMDNEQLVKAYNTRIRLTKNQLKSFATLWHLYVKGDVDLLKAEGDKIGQHFSFVPLAIKAHSERFPKNGGELSLLDMKLLEIIKKHGKDNFGKVFQEFNSKESIYGFGDLQVKRLFDRLVENNL